MLYRLRDAVFFWGMNAIVATGILAAFAPPAEPPGRPSKALARAAERDRELWQLGAIERESPGD
jgi:hypothetical protein